MRRKLQLILGAALSIVLLLSILKEVDLEKTAQVLGTTRYAYLVPAVLAMLCTFVVKTFRWKALLRPMGEGMQFRSLFPAVMIGYFANYLLPVNAGELVRTFVLGKEKNLSNSAVLGTIVVERMLDVSVLIGFLLAALLARPLPGWVHSMTLFVATALIGGWFVLWLTLWQRQRTNQVVQSILGRISSPLALRIAQALDRFLEGVGTLRSNGAMAWAMLLTILLWSCSTVTFYFVGEALSLTLPLTAYSLPVAIVNLGTAIPAMPGRVGTLEALCVSSLGLLAVESGVGLAFDVLMRVLYMVPTVWGWFHLYRAGFHLLNFSG